MKQLQKARSLESRHSFAVEAVRSSVANESILNERAGEAINSTDDAEGVVQLVATQLLPDAIGQPETPTRVFLSLNEMRMVALANSSVVKRDADFLNPISSNTLETASTRLDPAIARSGFLFGQRGIDAALSDFDWRWNKQIGTGENALIQNNRFLSGGIPPGGVLRNRTGQYAWNTTKNTRYGGQLRVGHELDYLASNVQDAFYPSSYSGRLRGEIRQPFLAGAGRQVTSVAGPLNGAIDGVTGVAQGVLVAKLQTQEAREQLNIAVSQLLRDVEILYFQLSASKDALMYFDQLIAEIGEIEKRTKGSVEKGAKGSSQDLLQIVQARNDVIVGRTTESRNNRTLATRLTRLVGIDLLNVDFELEKVPQAVRFDLDVESAHLFAIHQRSDLRILAIREQSFRAQYLAAKNLNRPQLDFVAGFNMNGFGDKMLAKDIPGPDNDTASFYRNLFESDNEGWDARLELSSVCGRRLARTREQNIYLQLRKLAMLQGDRKNEVLLELQQNARDIAEIYQMCEAREQQYQINQELQRSIKARQIGDFQLENSVLLANATSALKTSEIEKIRSEAEYCNALCEFLYRQGKIAEESRVFIQ